MQVPRILAHDPVADLLEVRNPIPHQLDGNGEDEKAEDLVDRTHGAWTEFAHQRASKAEEENDANSNACNADYHAEVCPDVIHVSSQSHNDADRSRPGH